MPREKKTPVYSKAGPFKMNGSPHKTGVIEGTSAYGSALKHAQSVGQDGTGMLTEEERIRQTSNRTDIQPSSLVGRVAGTVAGFGF
jgi:hypothetical protein